MRKTHPVVRALFAALLVIAALGASGCATMYVDGALKDVDASQVRKPVRPQDAQVLFTFQTRGTANAKATAFLKEEITKTVEASGLFASFGPDPSLSGAILNITINNVPLDDDAFAKGFATGLTFGLVGSKVTDGYVCTVEFLPPGSSQKVVAKSRHALHTTMGAKGAPKNAIKAKSINDAVLTMARQVVTAALKDLSQDRVFQ